MHKNQIYLHAQSSELYKIYVASVKRLYMSDTLINNSDTSQLISRRARFRKKPIDILFFDLLHFFFELDKMENLIPVKVDIKVKSSLILQCVCIYRANAATKKFDLKLENIKIDRSSTDYVLHAFVDYIEL